MLLKMQASLRLLQGSRRGEAQILADVLAIHTKALDDIMKMVRHESADSPIVKIVDEKEQTPKLRIRCISQVADVHPE